ncbi:ABC transporter ATP-binding protein [Streptomyces zhihengii]
MSLSIEAGETVALVGRSGSGKTSLLMALGLLATPDDGAVLVDGLDTTGLNDAELSVLRCEHIGFVFQSFNLLPQFTAEENVAMAHRGGLGRGLGRAAELLGEVGLANRRRHRPHQLSAGEQQRVAIARALVNTPSVVLADEPTGNLDAETEATVLDLLTRGTAESGTALLLVTHSADTAARAGRFLHMASGECHPSEDTPGKAIV